MRALHLCVLALLAVAFSAGMGVASLAGFSTAVVAALGIAGVALAALASLVAREITGRAQPTPKPVVKVAGRGLDDGRETGVARLSGGAMGGVNGGVAGGMTGGVAGGVTGGATGAPRS